MELSSHSPQNYSLKKFLILFPKKSTLKKVLIFQKIELSGLKIKDFLIFPQKSFSYILGNGTS